MNAVCCLIMIVTVWTLELESRSVLPRDENHAEREEVKMFFRNVASVYRSHGHNHHGNHVSVENGHQLNVVTNESRLEKLRQQILTFVEGPVSEYQKHECVRYLICQTARNPNDFGKVAEDFAQVLSNPSFLGVTGLIQRYGTAISFAVPTFSAKTCRAGFNSCLVRLDLPTLADLGFRPV